MATAKKITLAQKIRTYMEKHPNAMAKDVADKFNTTPAYVYAIRHSDRNKSAETITKQAIDARLKLAKIEGSKKMVRVYTGTSGQSITAHVDQVTNLTPEQQERLIANLGQPRTRMQGFDTLPKVGDTIGGLTLTRKGQDGGYVYRWVNEDAVKSGKVLVDDPAPITDNVNHPAHYKVGGIETIDFIEAKNLSYHLGNVVKYIARADSKGNREEDLLKARWYLNREIAKFSKEQA